MILSHFSALCDVRDTLYTCFIFVHCLCIYASHCVLWTLVGGILCAAVVLNEFSTIDCRIGSVRRSLVFANICAAASLDDVAMCS